MSPHENAVGPNEDHRDDEHILNIGGSPVRHFERSPEVTGDEEKEQRKERPGREDCTEEADWRAARVLEFLLDPGGALWRCHAKLVSEDLGEHESAHDGGWESGGKAGRR